MKGFYIIHASNKFARIQDPENRIPADEPVFLLRGQDVLAEDTLTFYLDAYKLQPGASAEIIESLEAQLRAIQNWPKKKVAD